MAQRSDDPHEAPEVVYGPDLESGLPMCIEHFRYGRGDDDRIVSDVSGRYPALSPNDGDDGADRGEDVSPLLHSNLRPLKTLDKTHPN